MPRRISQKAQLSLALFAFLCVVTPAYSSPSSKALPMPAQETAADPSSGSSIFSPPADAQNEIPTFIEAKDGNARLRKLLFGGKDEIPNFEAVRSIPSLTPQQRKNIRQIYGDAKEQLQPLVQQMMHFRDKYGGNQQAASQDPQAREAFMQLSQEIRDLRKNLWQQVKAQLTDEQMQQLIAMRKGELRPATFNAPILAGDKGSQARPAANDDQPGNRINRHGANPGNPERQGTRADDQMAPGEIMQPQDN